MPCFRGSPPRRRTALAALALAALAPALVRADEVVRIAIAVGVPRASVTAAGLQMEPLEEGARLAPVERGRGEVTLVGDGVAVDGRTIEAAGVLYRAPGAVVANGVSVRGEVEVRRSAAGLDVVHVLPLEEYVAAVTGAEMPASFPPEALRAQAVAARTFAVFKKLEAVAEGRPWHLGATVLHQVYRGSGADPRAAAAAAATAGEVLTYQHAPIAAFFHSACGGRTEAGADALGRDLPYLPSVQCGHCGASPRARWTVRVGDAELGRAVGLGRPVAAARVVSRTASGRASRVAFAAGGREVALQAVDLRQRLGYQRLPSLAFELLAGRGGVAFRGAGAGHGAGLCQWGAAGLARDGKGYRDILAMYYPGTEIVRMY